MNIHLFFQILAGIIVGWLAGLIVRGKGLGLIFDLVIGVLGVFLGTFCVRFFHIPVEHYWWGDPAAWVSGAVVLLIIIRIINRE